LQSTPSDSVFQRHTIEKLHGDERLPIFIPDVVDGADIRMVQGGRCLGFTLKSKKGLGVACQRVGEKLQCNEPVEASVLGLVDDSHAPAAHLFQNVVVRDVLVDQGERKPLSRNGRALSV
jgi:hypothetical protein